MWLNGLIHSTDASEFINILSKGCSVINYELMTRSLKPFVADFAIGDYTISDHLVLILQLTFKLLRYPQSAQPTMGLETPLKLTGNKLSPQKVQQILNKKICMASRSTIISQTKPDLVIKSYDWLIV